MIDAARVYAPVELAFTGPARPIPASRTPFTLEARLGDRCLRIPGFWDGGTRYLARFLPEEAGEWSWSTASEAAELHGRTGTVVVAGTAGRGPVRVADRFHFAHADGTPYRPVGATVYNWLHQDDELFAATIDAVTQARFTKLRFLVFPQAGDYVEHHPALLPFERGPAGWDVDRPNIAFFRRLDAAVAVLGERGIQADILILNAYDGGRFGLDGLTEEQDAAYLRYLVARLSAFPHVWWSLCNEFDLLDRPRSRWDRLGMLLAESDPHDHLRSIHNWIELFDHNRPWITHASIQNGHVTTELGRAGLYRDAYDKPVVLDEIKYEGDIPERWGHLSAAELVHQFWVATVSGCYASHGESFALPGGSLHIVEGGPLVGRSPQRLAFLRQVLEDLVIPGIDPIDKWDDPEHVGGVARRQYLRYFGRSAPDRWRFRLPQATNVGERLEPGDAFAVDIIDTWNMTVVPVARRFVLEDVQRNEAFAADAVELPAGEAIALRITRLWD
ncbi:apiosidase-like domain-containing protein [Microbacterium oleivorans]|uniref:DUF4038 domain-containing protein n=1 Tax=Microbacterium oleivorans TaxID=273677 RepID=A0A7D5EVL5_9MICO|nr:DUF4038 domain-containing protein [Microbacterium oleivorans]QLD11451.1 DUF4038 domain-containing protein [Microbacterium oleivorans]